MMAENKRSDRALLQVDKLCVSYGLVEALTNASITVGEGQIVTVIGPNGAGKTTMLSAIMGLLRSRGGITFDGDVPLGPQDPGVRCLVVRGRQLGQARGGAAVQQWPGFHAPASAQQPARQVVLGARHREVVRRQQGTADGQ